MGKSGRQVLEIVLMVGFKRCAFSMFAVWSKPTHVRVHRCTKDIGPVCMGRVRPCSATAF